jgi:hypothetical protein
MVRRANRKTSKAIKKEMKLVIIAAEGKNKTEKTYFNEFNSMQKQYRIISARGNNTDPVKIVNDAIISSIKEELDFGNGDRAFAVFDTDYGKEEVIRKSLQLAHANNIEVILSNPCFEVWLLLHFRYSTKGYASNSEVYNELLSYWPGYKKNISSYEKVNERYNKAIENAKRIKSFNNGTNAGLDVLKCNSSTDVYKIVDMLMNDT